MRVTRSMVSSLALVALVPFLLGAEGCHPTPVMDFLRDILNLLKGLEQRVSELEACDCGGVLAPACGEDGVTYVNACKARCAGVAVAYRGECEPAVCFSDAQCAQEEFCEFGICPGLPMAMAPVLRGECVAVPDVCPDVLAPVCGCDGVTYDNDCSRRQARVSKADDGPCEVAPARCGGIAGFECPSEDQVCIFPPGTCDIADNMGECVERPESCFKCLEDSKVCVEVYAPVCGCDGKTYPNECESIMAGVSIDYTGSCLPEPPICGGIEELECSGPDQMCNFPTGTCQDPDATGECIHRPSVCIGIGPPEPVCGCDGQTYGSECSAFRAGVSVLYEGECDASAS